MVVSGITAAATAGLIKPGPGGPDDFIEVDGLIEGFVKNTLGPSINRLDLGQKGTELLTDMAVKSVEGGFESFLTAIVESDEAWDNAGAFGFMEHLLSSTASGAWGGAQGVLSGALSDELMDKLKGKIPGLQAMYDRLEAIEEAKANQPSFWGKMEYAFEEFGLKYVTGVTEDIVGKAFDPDFLQQVADGKVDEAAFAQELFVDGKWETMFSIVQDNVQESLLADVRLREQREDLEEARRRLGDTQETDELRAARLALQNANHPEIQALDDARDALENSSEQQNLNTALTRLENLARANGLTLDDVLKPDFLRTGLDGLVRESGVDAHEDEDGNNPLRDAILAHRLAEKTLHESGPYTAFNEANDAYEALDVVKALRDSETENQSLQQRLVDLPDRILAFEQHVNGTDIHTRPLMARYATLRAISQTPTPHRCPYRTPLWLHLNQCRWHHPTVGP